MLVAMCRQFSADNAGVTMLVGDNDQNHVDPVVTGLDNLAAVNSHQHELREQRRKEDELGSWRYR